MDSFNRWDDHVLEQRKISFLFRELDDCVSNANEQILHLNRLCDALETDPFGRVQRDELLVCWGYFIDHKRDVDPDRLVGHTNTFDPSLPAGASWPIYRAALCHFSLQFATRTAELERRVLAILRVRVSCETQEPQEEESPDNAF
jgi:hypothetical protein